MKNHVDICQLLDEKIIDDATAERISEYYRNKETNQANVLFTVFGIFGAALVGLGIILIIAHNWDNFGNGVKTTLGFIPLAIAQGLSIYSFKERKGQTAWIEGSAISLIMAIGACIAMISQIYHSHGSINDFLWIWLLLTLPVMYLFPSAMAALLSAIGILVYIINTGRYALSENGQEWWAWIFLSAMMPYYYRSLHHNGQAMITSALSWIVPLIILFGIISFAGFGDNIMLVCIMLLCGIFYLIGHQSPLPTRSLSQNGFIVIGSIGTFLLLFTSSFRTFWTEVRNDFTSLGSFQNNAVWYLLIFLLLIFIYMFYNYVKVRTIDKYKPIAPIALIYFIIFFSGMNAGISATCINILTLILGVLTVWQGIKQDHLGILNYGLIIISILIVCRFFDTNISFIWRGLLFVLVGLGFFFANNQLLKYRKK